MRHFACFLALLLLRERISQARADSAVATAALFVLTSIGVPVHKDWDLIHVNYVAALRSAETIAQVGVLGICYHSA